MTLANEALSTSEALGEWGVEARARRVVGDVMIAREPAALDDAAAHYRRALERAASLGMQPLTAECHVSVGRLHARAGRIADAARSFDEARALFRGLGMRQALASADAARAGLDVRPSS
jgi:hypothetical protein